MIHISGQVMGRLMLLVAFLTVLVIQGCKLAVIIGEGGEVQSAGAGTCISPTAPQAGVVCIHEITDTNYSETFTAVADRGWYFVKWNAGDLFLCPNSAKPACTVSNVGSAGNEDIEAMVASDMTFYIMPVFAQGEPEPIPDTDTVTVNGRQWAQPALFVDVFSREDIEAVCPEGVCEGRLDGYSMTGWTWASVEDLNALFNHYIGSQALGPGPDFYQDDSTLAAAFFADGWWIFRSPICVGGHLRDGQAQICIYPPSHVSASTALSTFAPGGGWFYRTP